MALVTFLSLTASRRALILAINSASAWLILPTVTCMRGNLASALTTVLPASNSLAFFSGSGVTVPALGEGMRPFGPRTLANLASLGMKAGEVTKISNSILPFSISLSSSSVTIATLLAAPAM